MQTTLESDLIRYIEELKSASEICARPDSNGFKCAQCYERIAVIGRLRDILKSQYDFSRADAEFLAACKIAANAS